jgi:hypothetical protein
MKIMVKRDQPQSLTNLPPSPGEDRRARMIRYSVAMGVRTLCVIACIIARDSWVLVLIFGIGAVALPYVAVVFANVGAASPSQATAVRPIPIVPVLEAPRERPQGQ